MKNLVRFTGLVAAIILVLFAASILNCAKTKTTTAPPQVITYNLTGKVLGSDDTAISGATVTLLQNGAKVSETTSGASGSYTFTGLKIGSYTVSVAKSGFTFGQAIANVKENGVVVSSIVLTSLAQVENRKEQTVTANDIKQSTVTVASNFQTEVSTGGTGTTQQTQTASVAIQQNTVIKIDNQTVTDPVKIVVTPMQIDNVPAATQGEMQVGNVLLEPANATFDKPVDVKIPLDIQLPAGIEIPVKKYENGAWVEIGTATIDSTGLGANSKLSEFGQISIQPKVDIASQSATPQETPGATQNIPQDQTQVAVKISDTVTFDEGLPPGITPDYAMALIERQEGVIFGLEEEVTLNLPTVTGTAKPATPLSASKAEVWVQICTMTRVTVTVIKTITLRITIGSRVYTYVINYKYTTIRWRLDCTRTWVEHTQGRI